MRCRRPSSHVLHVNGAQLSITARISVIRPFAVRTTPATHQKERRRRSAPAIETESHKYWSLTAWRTEGPFISAAHLFCMISSSSLFPTSAAGGHIHLLFRICEMHAKFVSVDIVD
jgi:hypothetical protein